MSQMMSRNKRTALLALTVALTVAPPLVAGAAGATAQAADATPAALSADAFVSSIGVNTHTGYMDRSYGNYTVWRDRLVESGIRNIRDGVAVGQPPVYDRLNELAAKGIKTDLQLGRPFYGKWSGLTGDAFSVANNPAGTLDQLVGVLKTNLLGAVSSIEGPNEYDLSGDPNWIASLRTYQTNLYNAIKSDPATASLPVIAPSLVYGESRSALGVVPSDLGNMHNYTGGQQETSSHLDSELAQAAKVSGGKPAWSTESNPNTAVGQVGNQPAVSEKAQSIYTLRQYLEDWRKGVKRTFIYELMDETSSPLDAEMTWGILHADGTPKPAFTTIKNTIGLLADPGPSFTPGTMSPTLTGANASTRSTLLQKRDGSYYLALWQEDSVYDTAAKRDLSPLGTPVTVTVPTSSAFTTFRPTDGTSATGTASGTSITLTSSATPTIIQIKAAGTSTPTTPPSGGAFALRINAGGAATTDGGNAWAADKYFLGGKTSSTSATVSSPSPRVDRDQRVGATGYDIPVPAAGTYRLRLHVTENYFAAAGKRDFDVTAEGMPLVTDLDVYRNVGKNRTYVIDQPVTVTDGTLSLRFPVRVNNAAVSGIEVLESPAVTPVAKIDSGWADASSVTGFAADGMFTGGNPNKVYTPVSSPDAEADSSERWAVQSYHVPVPAAGTYRVRLHSTELCFDAPGRRVFDVAAEGQPFVTGLDVYAMSGKNTAYIQDRPVTVTDGALDLTFTSRADNATVSSIEVLPMS